MRTSFKTLASKKATTWRLKQSHSNDKLLRKVMSSSYHIAQKRLSKQVVPITYTLEKMVFTADIFKDLRVVSFQTKLKNMWYTLVCLSLPCISRGKKTK